MGHLSNEQITAFCVAWCAGEDSLKGVEAELLQLPLQPINELRYATRHLARAIEATDAAACLKEYDAAMRHCVCAAYDTAEAVLVARCARFKQFQEDFSDFPIETPVLDYKAAVIAYRLAQDAMSRDPDDRHNHKARVQEACANVKQFDDCLDEARNELNKKRDKARVEEEARRVSAQAALAAEREKRRQWQITAVIALVAALAACAKVAVG